MGGAILNKEKYGQTEPEITVFQTEDIAVITTSV